MQTHLKLLAPLVLVAALLVGAGGCTWVAELPFLPTATVPSMTATPSTSLPTATVTPTLTPGASSQGLTVELWVPEFLTPHVEGEDPATFAAQLAAFEASYTFRGLHVNTTVKKGTGEGGIYNLLTTASEVAPAVLPDLVVLNQHDLLAAAADGLFQPIDAELLPYPDYYTTTLSSVRNSTGVWAFPYLARADHMVYREGITGTAPLTWSAVLSGSYETLLTAASPDGLSGDALLQIYLGLGGRVMDVAGQASLDRASLERTYGFLFGLQRAGLLDSERLLNLQNTAACWSAYQEGMGDLSPVSFGQFWPEPPAGSRPAWAPTEDGAPITVAYTWGLAIVTQDPARRGAALVLARWLIAPNHMVEMAEAMELAPTRRAAIEEWGLAAEDFTFVDTLLSRSLPALPPSVDTPVRRALQAGLVALLQQEADTPESAASTALTALRR